jgi:chemotaxis methyl-accepting protein methylase
MRENELAALLERFALSPEGYRKVRNNLLTYYRDEIVKAALPPIVGSLVPGGYLVIGRKEQLPDLLKGFHTLPEVSCL